MNCPTNDQLLAYTTGHLDEQTSEVLAEHLRTCETCRTRLSTIDDSQDSLLARLRRTPVLDAYEQEPQCEQAAQLAAALMPAAVGEAADQPALAVPADGDAECPPTFLSEEPHSDPGSTADPTAALVRELGEYELLEKLGEGGMGAVYKARHRRLDKIVAVKVLPPDRMAEPMALARFDREMRAVGRLTHPNIVQAFDAREIDGTHFLAMEYVAGMDLGEVVLNGGAMRIADACEVVRQIASGLQCAHENDLVHRDIKPSNAILTPGGQVKILDLGLARLSSGATNMEASRGEMTTSGTAMGTADYMAPEQASDSHTADIRADIYSLGCTLYKLLSGKPPFSGPKYKNAMEKIMGHMRDAPPPIGLLRTDVTGDLAAVMDRMMAKDRDQRFATPQEVADALQPFASGANLIRLYREADAMRRGEPLPEPSVMGTEPGAPSAVSDTARHLQPAASSSRLAQPAPAPAERSISLAGARNLVRNRPRVVIALGLVGLAVLAGVIVITVRDRFGKIVSQTTVSDDHKVEVTHQADGSSEKPANAPALPIGQWVPLIKSEEDLKAWQKTGTGTVAFENGAVRLQNAAVTYPTLAIDLVIRVQIQVEVNVKPTAKLLLRQTSAGSYAAVLEEGSKLVVGVTEGEKWRELKSTPVTVAAAQPLALEFSAVGDVLAVSLNGKPAIEVQDGTHSYGSPGLAATDGTRVFRDIQVNLVRSVPPNSAIAGKAAKERRSVEKQPAGVPNYGLEFDGKGDWIETDLHYDGTTPLTMEAIINCTDTAVAEHTVIGNQQSSGVALKFDGLWVGFAVHDGSTYQWVNSDAKLGKRVHLAGVFDGRNLSLYVDGKKQRKVARLDGPHLASQLPILIGADPGNTEPEHFFSGYIDAVRISFATLYDKDFEPETRFRATDSTVLLYHLDEAQGLVARDDSGKNHHGRIGGLEKWVRVGEGPTWPALPWILAKDSPPPAIAPFDAKQARAHQEAWAKHLSTPVETTNSIGMKLVLIPPGEYDMGLTPEDMEAAKQDVAKAAPALAGFFARTLPLATPKHRVRIRDPFQIGACEVTQEQFGQFVQETGYRTTSETPGPWNRWLSTHPDSTWAKGTLVSWRNPSAESNAANEPVINVTLHDARAFCDWLSQKEQADYRIPTEEEWEFACRAGGAAKYGFTAEVSELTQYGWMDEPGSAAGQSRGDRPHPVAAKLPNPFGMYDTLGNVSEVCLQSFYPNQDNTLAGVQSCLRGSDRSLPAVGGLHAYRVPWANLRILKGDQGFRIVRDFPVALPQPPDDPTEAERWVANRLLERGASLTIRTGGTTQAITAPGPLPTGAFSVESVTLGPGMRLKPAEFAYLQRLPNLATLLIDNFAIDASAARRLVGFEKLTDVQIGYCAFPFDGGMKYLGRNESIRRVTVNSPIDRTLADLSSFKDLEEVTLSDVGFTDEGLKHLTGLQKLRRLVLTGTAIGDAGVKHLAGLRGLTDLSLARTRVTDAGLAPLASCEALEILDLSGTATTGTGLAPLAKFRRLVTLRLDSSKLTDEGCAALAMFTTLRSLDLNQTDVTDAGFKRLEGLTELRDLNLSGTRLSDAGLVAVGRLRRLTKLTMWNTVITDQGVDSLRGLTDLQDLTLGWTRVGNRAVDICVGFPSLKGLLLHGTYVTDACVEKLVLLSKASDINLSSTGVSAEKAGQLTARLPSCKITWLDAGDFNRETLAVYLATYHANKASAKLRLPNGATQVVTGREFIRTYEPRSQVLELCAEGCPIGDAALNDVRFLKTITLLNLKNARITNRGVQDLAGLTTLETLILDANPIDDSALPHLYGLTALRSLSLRATRVTPAGVQALMDKLPECRVESDLVVTRTGGPLFGQSPATQPAAIPGLRSWSVLPIAHRDSVTAVACSPSSADLIALAGDDGDKSPATVRVWNRNAQSPETSPVWIGFGHTKKIQALAWSPDGKYLASTGQDLTVKVWEPATGRCLRTFQLNNPGNALAWSPTMDRLAVACDASVALIALKDGELQEVADGAVKSGLAWSPDGARFVVGTGTATTFTLTVYDAATFTAERAITSEDYAGKSATWSPDGKRLAATLGDGIIRMWDVETLDRVRDLTAPAGAVGLLAWSPKGDRLASAGKQLIVWDAEKGTQLASCPLESGTPLGLGWTADGQHVAVQSAKDIGVHAAANGTLVDTLSVTGPIPAAKLTIQPDGHYRAIGPIADQLVYVTLTDDYRQETYTPAAFAAKYGWKN